MKWACLLSQNQIREIVMDSDSDEDNVTHLKTWKTKRSHAHLRDGLPFHSLQAQIFSRFVRTEIILRITTQEELIRHLFIPLPYKHNVNKRT